MRTKMIWGLVILIVLLLGVSVFLLTRTTETEPERVYKPLTPSEKEQVNRNIQDVIKKEKVPTAKPGYRIEQHGNHEVPVAEAENTTPIVPVPKTESSGLTYHADLLQTNPVKALRLQTEERGHWSAEHIPPFPPDDTEAADLAQSLYLMHYYESLGMLDTPIWSKAARAFLSQRRVIKSQYPSADPVTAREMDLWRLTWTNTNAGEITPYGGMTRFGRARMFLSDYFPDFIDAPK